MAERPREHDRSTNKLLDNLLAMNCLLAEANAGAVLRRTDEGRIDVLALHPTLSEGEAAPAWLSRSLTVAEECLSSANTTVKSFAGESQASGRLLGSHVVMVPGKIAGNSRIAVAYFLSIVNEAAVDEKRQRLETSATLLTESLAFFPSQSYRQGLVRMQQAMEVLSAVNRERRFVSAAMAFCNETASQWRCERTSIGFVEGRYVKLKAMSYAEDYSRKMKLVQAIEASMEECSDQDVEITSPAPEGAVYVTRASDELSKLYGPFTVLSLPLRRDDEVVGAVTFERPLNNQFTAEEVETIRLTCELACPRLLDLYEHDRWLGAIIGSRITERVNSVFGPGQAWAKVTAVIFLVALLFLIFAKGQFRAEAPCVIEAIQQQVVPAPFDGYIKSVEVEVGDIIKGGDSVLGELDTAELRLQLAEAKAEKAGYLKQSSAAMRDGETAQAQIAQANADKAQAQIDLFSHLISRAKLVSPLSGVVVKGDLKREIGAPVKTGDVLFEVAPIESLRAELLVSEDLVVDIQVGQEGQLATASYPGKPIRFVVERINPMAETVNHRNVFKVRVRLQETYQWLRPGMEGVAKVSVGNRRYVWIWTRKVVNWLRMKLWL